MKTNESTNNVIEFPHTKRKFSIDVLSDQVVEGMVLIEACIPVAVFEALIRQLQTL